jgi:hypothetical protein
VIVGQVSRQRTPPAGVVAGVYAKNVFKER